MKKYIFDMSLGWIIKVYLANLVAGVIAMCLFGYDRCFRERETCGGH